MEGVYTCIAGAMHYYILFPLSSSSSLITGIIIIPVVNDDEEDIFILLFIFCLCSPIPQAPSNMGHFMDNNAQQIYVENEPWKWQRWRKVKVGWNAATPSQQKWWQLNLLVYFVVRVAYEGSFMRDYKPICKQVIWQNLLLPLFS